MFLIEGATYQLTIVQIILISLGALLFLFFIFEVVALSLLTKHNDRIEKRNHNVNILLAQKYDILILIARIFKKYNLEIPSEFEEELSPKMEDSLRNLTLTERLTVKAYLMKASQSLLYFAETNKNVKNDNEFKILKKSLLTIDVNYRKAISLYNADALGFNYWIHFPLFRPIAIVKRFKDKEILS
ncbi:MAG: hypothetical protein J1F31_00785 [Erysipelotrichales bacterium]|nr:hypothetical protein [Erysipelotrichales bacterium]